MKAEIEQSKVKSVAGNRKSDMFGNQSSEIAEDR